MKQPTVGNDYLRRALALNPKDNRPRIWIAQTLTALDSLPEAMDMYQQAILADSSAEAFRGAGVVMLLQKNWADAIPYLQRAVQAEPDNLQGHVWLAQAYSNSGQVNDAKAEFNRAIDIDPNNPDAARGLELIRKYEAQKALKAAGGQKAADTTAAPAGAKPGKTGKAADPAAASAAKAGGAIKK